MDSMRSITIIILLYVQRHNLTVWPQPFICISVFEICFGDAAAPSTFSTKSMDSTFVRLELSSIFYNRLTRALLSFGLYH